MNILLYDFNKCPLEKKPLGYSFLYTIYNGTSITRIGWGMKKKFALSKIRLTENI